jgi:hypothetical protein
MSLTKLVLIVPKTDSKGKTIFKRKDTDEIIPKERIQMIKQPPLIIHLDPPFDLPIYMRNIRGFREKANAVLVGGMMGKEDDVYCSLAYCKI